MPLPPRQPHRGCKPARWLLQDILGCALGVPLPVTAMLAIGIDAAEVLFALGDVYYVGSTNAQLAAPDRERFRKKLKS